MHRKNKSIGNRIIEIIGKDIQAVPFDFARNKIRMNIEKKKNHQNLIRWLVDASRR